ncbi:MAG: hypothetical protein NTX04_03225, partial [Verrucomicrobia bacterium]|nr:hypothetical protein [Verrucomicrobiota bacterium]
VIIVENGIKTPFTILDGDITKLAAKLQGIREKTIAEAAAALAETELGPHAGPPQPLLRRRTVGSASL